MESLDELAKSSGKPSFFKHVFNFDEKSKCDMLNIIQYTVLAIIPVVILNKMMQRFVPEADEEKGSFELTAEVLAQIIFMFLGIFFVNRLVTFVPTYSGEQYPEWNSIMPILPMLVILASLQTKLGEKIAILVDRVVALWEGPKDKKGKKKGANGTGTVKVSQPISQPMTQSSMGSTSISSLPQMQQQLPNYDQMYQQDPTPLVGAASPGMMENFEPMAANAMGGSAFGSAFGSGF